MGQCTDIQVKDLERDLLNPHRADKDLEMFL